MVQLKNVAVFGGTGALGGPILDAIIKSGKFNVTAISRVGSSATFPSGIEVVRADYKSLESLTSALKGQDAVVSAVGTPSFLDQKLFFDAAVAAGVKRFIPSEFGSDLANPKSAVLPVFAHKVEVYNHIHEKLAAGADITYSDIRNSAFLDWGLEHEFILNWTDGKPKIFDGGDQLFSTTTLASVADAVVGILTHYEETKNKSLYIQDLAISQNQLLKILQKIAPEKKLEPVQLSLADTLKSSYDSLSKGDFSYATFAGFLFSSIFGGEAYNQPFSQNDNELLGVKGKTLEDVEAIFKAELAKKN